VVEPADAVDFVLRDLAGVKVAVKAETVKSVPNLDPECNPDLQFVGEGKTHIVPLCVCVGIIYLFFKFLSSVFVVFFKKK
jgi:hypothetical protein